MTTVYCLDTSTLINGWKKHYAPKAFPSVWDALDQMMKGGTVVSCRDVYDEVLVQADELAAWVKSRKSIFYEPNELIRDEFQKIMRQYPNFVATGGARNKADPFVIAHAKTIGAVVVTYEQYQKNTPKPTKPPSIVNVCEELGVLWMPPWSFLEASGVCL